MRRAVRRLVLAGLVAVLFVSGLAGTAASASPAAVAEGRRTHMGAIDGAPYRVEMPDHWNGTLVLYSHGYQPVQFRFFEGIWLTNRPPDRSETEAWLLAHGYALAGSLFQNEGYGFQNENALHDQIALLDWFEANVGRPRRTISTGQSMGAAIAVQLAERHPDRFDGVGTVCGVFDPNGTFNAVLDMNFAIKTLLAPDNPDIELVHVTDPATSADALVAAIDAARTSDLGQARLALIASLNNVTGWYSAHLPQPTTAAARIDQQANWLANAYVLGLGPHARMDLESHAGGNPSTNVGIDYRRQLARSDQRHLVRQAYRDAGFDLDADLALLAAAPRIAADPQAVDYMDRVATPQGDTSVPIITIHSIGDGGAVPDQERWFASQLRQSHDRRELRQLFVDRGQHCSFSAADEIVMLRSLFERIETGRWPNTNPRRLNDEVRALGEGYQKVIDIPTFDDEVVPPAFIRYTPPVFLRPSR